MKASLLSVLHAFNSTKIFSFGLSCLAEQFRQTKTFKLLDGSAENLSAVESPAFLTSNPKEMYFGHWPISALIAFMSNSVGLTTSNDRAVEIVSWPVFSCCSAVSFCVGSVEKPVILCL